MRNMSFSMTTEQIKNRSKTVTRRLGWWFLRPGDRIQAVEKARGLKKGEKLKRLCVIEVVSTRAERVRDITEDDCRREGFPKMTPFEFAVMICRHYNVGPLAKINRIEFKYV